MRRSVSLVGLVLVALPLAGCPSNTPAGDPGTDHTIAKLKQEQARLAREGQPAPTPRGAPKADPLAEAVAAPSQPEDLTLPASAPTKLGDATVKLTGLRRSQAVAGAKVTLTTADAFVRVELSVLAGKGQTVSLNDATLHKGAQTFELATDAMRVGGGSPTRFELVPGEERSVVLYFELPREAVGPGLALTLPSAGPPVEVPLQ